MFAGTAHIPPLRRAVAADRVTPRGADARFLGLVLAAALGCPTAVAGQALPSAAPATPATQAARLDAGTRRAVIDTIAAQLGRFYVDADTGRMIATHLRGRLQAGAYERLADPRDFADRLTTDLRAVNGDKHLSVRFAPEQPAMRPGPEGIRMDAPDPPPPPAMVAEMRRRHFGLGRVDLLPGNIGYVRLDGFPSGPEAEAAALAAIRYLEFADAVVFDLRRNGGGSPEQVNFIISHFAAPGVPSLTVSNRSAGETFTRKTLAQVPGPRRVDVPLYVLTSAFTASAGEDFTFVLQNLKRATIVGGVTAGAGHNNALLDSGHGFRTSVSFTRVADPATGREWERVGVQPDVRVDPDSALEVAQALALERLAAGAEGARKRELELTRESLEAARHPLAVPTASLAAYVGEYEGGSVAFVDGRLLYRRMPGAPADTLVPLSDSRFSAGGARRVEFARDASGAIVLRMLAPDGSARTFARRQPAPGPGS